MSFVFCGLSGAKELMIFWFITALMLAGMMMSKRSNTRKISKRRGLLVKDHVK